METTEYIDTLRREGELLADAAERAGEHAPVPTCPGWTTGDLVRHTSTFHRWAARIVAGSLPGPVPEDPAPGVPTGTDLWPWFRDGHAALLRTLEAAGPAADCWTFLPGAPPPLTFWARRQAHETAVHRVDAESARRGELTPLDAAFAADGIDELLTGFHARTRSRVRTERPRTLRVRPTDTDTGPVWTVRLSADAPPRAERSADGPADCELSGPAQTLYLLLWNRLPLDAAAVTGDRALADLWRRTSGIG
ncbi:maleylpyruvate isomerase family mycothiol-dependent enzyme [Streptomyces zhihengii]|uniref:Maleylpyruvate isomerase family mycothiol-dependent enzyme n=1 Tax=Streptomyces zhihengii TaxID=1818004 RepID=A0ABS2UMR5_9ACTN|nr:maleylpyruvate isomerase family mycothiol-dependent enzyme [Streptomyces zhihengii]MBM9618177.1 maleylpyruvate isomerase family mycothiol-dependent enzyme [Streptomyces zhihengii]